jgi:hypothetical protein
LLAKLMMHIGISWRWWHWWWWWWWCLHPNAQGGTIFPEKFDSYSTVRALLERYLWCEMGKCLPPNRRRRKRLKTAWLRQF